MEICLNKKEAKRLIWLDLLRIISSILIVFLHISAKNVPFCSIGTFEWNVFNFYGSITRGAVPVFFMISGAMLLNPAKVVTIHNLYKVKIVRLFGAYVIWSLIYEVVEYYTYKIPFSFKNIVKGAINSHYHMWFIPATIAIYMLIPIVRKIMCTADTKILSYFTILFFIAICFYTILRFPSLPHFTWVKIILNKYPITILCQNIGYCILGYYLYSIDIEKKTRIALYIAGIISAFACIYISYIMSLNANETITVLFDNFSITSFFQGIALFTFFKSFFSRYTIKEKFKKMIILVSNCSFGIYLVHPLFLIIMDKSKVISTLSFNPILSVFIISFVVVALSFLLALILKKLPFVGKWIV